MHRRAATDHYRAKERWQPPAPEPSACPPPRSRSCDQTLHQDCPRFIDGALVRLVQQVFARDEVVEAYFYPWCKSQRPRLPQALHP